MASQKTWTEIYKILARKAHERYKHIKDEANNRRDKIINNLIKYIKENKTSNHAICDYRLTREFCKKHAIDPKPLMKWLHQNGGFSDYYILKNLDKPEETPK